MSYWVEDGFKSRVLDEGEWRRDEEIWAQYQDKDGSSVCFMRYVARRAVLFRGK